MKHIKTFENYDPMGSWDPNHPSNKTTTNKELPKVKGDIVGRVYNIVKEPNSKLDTNDEDVKSFIYEKPDVVTKWAVEHSRIDLLQDIKDFGLFDKITDSEWKDIFDWARISRRLDRADSNAKEEMISWLKNNTDGKI